MNKLRKYAEITAFENVLEAFTFGDGYLHANARDRVKLKSKWSSEIFKNNHPLYIELACGKGDYALGLAELYPDRNFIGMDIRGNRIWKGAKKASKNEMDNVVFLRSRIEFIQTYFASEEISGIWITFPDPFGKDKDIRRRLTSPQFLDRYVTVLKPGGSLHLKTDDDPLYHFTLESLRDHPRFKLVEHVPDLYKTKDLTPDQRIITFYEQQHLDNGEKIKYIRAEVVK